MGWHHVPFRDVFTKRLPKPVLIENDANVAALAESVIGVSYNAAMYSKEDMSELLSEVAGAAEMYIGS